MSELRWDDLAVFLAVVRGGTLARAGAELGINASTVHRRVGALEEALSTLLFERGARGYVLTEVGEAMVEQAEAVEESVAALRRAVSGHDRSARGPVTLTLPETLVDVIAPALIELRATCPRLRPVVVADARQLDLGRDADLALRPGAAPPDSAVGRRVGTVGWAAYGHAQDSRAPWVIYAEGFGPAPVRAHWRSAHGEEPVAAEVTSVGAMRSVIAAMDARGLLPCYLGDSSAGLCRLTPGVVVVESPLWLLIHADLRRSARVRAVIDHLVPTLERAAERLAG